MRPFCFVLMPFGIKRDDSGRNINFDEIYHQIIAPACDLAELDPIRADEEILGGIIHKPMFERLMLCDYAVADLSTANANVFYELGVRHGIRPYSTVLIFGSGMRLPFDVAPLRGLPYKIDANGSPEDAITDARTLADRLQACRNPTEDSPLYQLITDWPRPDIKRLKTDTFRELIEYANKYKGRLKSAREQGVSAVEDVERQLKVIDADPAVVVDLFLSYRAVNGWEQMISLVAKMPPVLQRTVTVREQLALALNRVGRWREAEEILLTLIADRGASSETNGILGRVYKSRWQESEARGETELAKGFLRKAVDAYVAGFESDWRDAYPGINAVTLMEVGEVVDERQAALLPVVAYSVARRIEQSRADYWDWASLLELKVLLNDRDAANQALENALAAASETWQPETTANNIRMIRDARSARGEGANWIAPIEAALSKRASTLAS